MEIMLLSIIWECFTRKKNINIVKQLYKLALKEGLVFTALNLARFIFI